MIITWNAGSNLPHFPRHVIEIPEPGRTKERAQRHIPEYGTIVADMGEDKSSKLPFRRLPIAEEHIVEPKGLSDALAVYKMQETKGGLSFDYDGNRMVSIILDIIDERKQVVTPEVINEIIEKLCTEYNASQSTIKKVLLVLVIEYSEESQRRASLGELLDLVAQGIEPAPELID